MKVWHLNHSGVAVETENHLLFFDIFGEALTPAENEGLEKGVINPAQMQDKDILFFVSHEHHDHFDPKIFGLDKMGKRVRYVLPEEFDEIFEDGIFVHANMQVQLEDCRITTLDSTDIGVAYLVEIDGMRIYHAGDLNWWHWEGEPASWNRNMETGFRREIDSIAGERFDAAFVPLDPRLEAAYGLGMDYFLQKTSATHVFPMHMWEEYGYISKYKETQTGRQHAAQIVDISRRGEEFML